MPKHEFDLVVIGSGPGGYVAAIRAAQQGLKVACVEKEGTLGGTCLNVGCIPSKALLQTTEHYAWIKKESPVHGISCLDVTINFPHMMERKYQIIKGLTEGIAALFKQHDITVFHGVASFQSPNEISILDNNSKRTVTADNFILATGSEPIPLPFLPFDETTVVSSTGALSLQSIPKKMIVIGGGVIGVELASVYNRLGSEIVVIEMLDGICAGMDDALRKALLQSLKKQGMQFYLGSKVTKAERKDSQLSLSFECGGKENQLQADVVLVAIGRRPYTTDLGLEKIGIQTEKGFINVDGNFHTSLPHIYAIGDLIKGPMLAHRASEEGVATAEIIAGRYAEVNYMAVPNVIYTHPEAASVGLTENEAREMGLDIVVGKAPYKGNSRARCSGDAEGFVKVIGAGKNRTLIGLHMIGAQVSEMINIGVVAIENKTTLHEIAYAPIAHPTLSEAIKEACGNALGVAIHTQTF